MQTHRGQLHLYGIIHADLHHGGQHDATHPQAQDGVERSHRRPIVLDVVDRMAIKANGRSKCLRQRLGVITDQLANLLEITVLDRHVELRFHLLQIICGRIQRGRGICQDPLHIAQVCRQGTRCALQTVHRRVDVVRNTGCGRRNVLNRGLQLLSLALQRLIVVALNLGQGLLRFVDQGDNIGAGLLGVRKTTCQIARRLAQAALKLALLGRDARQTGDDIVQARLKQGLQGVIRQLLLERLDVRRDRLDLGRLRAYLVSQGIHLILGILRLGSRRVEHIVHSA